MHRKSRGVVKQNY